MPLLKYTLPLVLVLLLNMGSAAYAQDHTLIPESGITGACNFMSGDFGADCIPDYIVYLIGVLYRFAGAIFLFMIIVAGYRLVLGFGDKEAGKNQLYTAIVGFIVTSLAFYIIDFVIGALAGRYGPSNP